MKKQNKNISLWVHLRYWMRVVLPSIILCGMTTPIQVQASVDTQIEELAFTLTVKPQSGSYATYTVTNLSDTPLHSITLQKANGGRRFLHVKDVSIPAATLSSPSYESDSIRGILKDYWKGSFGAHGKLEKLILNPIYPDGFTSRSLDNVNEYLCFRTGPNTESDFGDDYAQRLRGYFVVPLEWENKSVCFKLISDDHSRLEVFDFKGVKVAWTAGTHSTTNETGWVNLKKNDVFFFDIHHVEGYGYDYLEVQFIDYDTATPVEDRRKENWKQFPLKYFYQRAVGYDPLPLPDGRQEGTNLSVGSLVKLININANNNAGLGKGEKITFTVGMDGKDVNVAKELWNNLEANTKMTVYGKGENQIGHLTFPKTTKEDAIEEKYNFKSDSFPRTLIVRSEYPEEVDTQSRRYKVNLIDQRSGETISNGSIDMVLGRDNGNWGDWVDDNTLMYKNEYLTNGVRVEIQTEKEIYLNKAGRILYTSGCPTDVRNAAGFAYQRYVATGISVNNSVETGDPTDYGFTLDEDTTVVIRWRHEYALRIKSNFNKTESPFGATNRSETPWIAALSSQALGSPTPIADVVHWIPRGDEVVSAIDGSWMDLFSKPGLNIRFVPYRYEIVMSDDAPLEIADFKIGHGSLPPRQQIAPFTMDRWADITYHWKVQYGVEVLSDLTHGGLGHVYNVEHGERELILNDNGVVWFDEGDDILVTAARDQQSVGQEQALTGWNNGDIYYFATNGKVDTGSGNLKEGTSIKKIDGVDVATWMNNFQADGAIDHCGMEINNLMRPVRVSWNYGDQEYWDDHVTIGEYVFLNPTGAKTLRDNYDKIGAVMRRKPDLISFVSCSGLNETVANEDMLVWDPIAKKLFPVVPGQSTATWHLESGAKIILHITAKYPNESHYNHVVGSPAVQLTPDPSGNFIFNSVEYTENNVTIEDGSIFNSEEAGRTVLQFSQILQDGGNVPASYVAIRVVTSRLWKDSVVSDKEVIIGSSVADERLDKAGLGTGFLRFAKGVRYNTSLYDSTCLRGITASQIYDMDALNAVDSQKKILHPEALPGFIFPVNLHPGATENKRITITWYDDPVDCDGIMWPYATSVYLPRWPKNEKEGLGRIVIASELGSESLNLGGKDQIITPEVGNTPATTVYTTDRFQGLKVYVQNDSTLSGYNPNEEHALLAPSKRFAEMNPRPTAVYAMRDNDLNIYNESSLIEGTQNSTSYTSHPFVLVQYYDALLQQNGMHVYSIYREDHSNGYHFANIANTDAKALNLEPHKKMAAGEPVPAFYPIGVLEGAQPCYESIGTNIKTQSTYWVDHKGGRWAVSGGNNAWFTVAPFYPMQPDFWWPADKAGAIQMDDGTNKYLFPQIGASLSFLPSNIQNVQNAMGQSFSLNNATYVDNYPKRILYKSDWPRIAPILKAGETLSYSGGEYRSDHPTMQVPNAKGTGIETIQTPGLPSVIGMAVSEVIFDSLNPEASEANFKTHWTARTEQVLEVRTVPLESAKFPNTLLPASGASYVFKGKYYLSALPASLQKRVCYNPTDQRLEMIGFANEKGVTDRTLTASPAAVYAIEPNVLTALDKEDLMSLSIELAWTDAVKKLYNLTRNPRALTQTAEIGDGNFLVGLQPKTNRSEVTGKPIFIEKEGIYVKETTPATAERTRAFGPGAVLFPNPNFMDPTKTLPDVNWVTVVENNDESMGGSPVALHVIKVSRKDRFRGAIKTVLSTNPLDENVILAHTGDFGGNADGLVYEWWYRPDDGSLNVQPPFVVNQREAGPWKLFADRSGAGGKGQNTLLLKGSPNAPEALLADSWWFVRYRHEKDNAANSNWFVPQDNGDPKVNFEWAGAGNNDPFNDFNMDGYPDYLAQLNMGWIKRVLDVLNPYEARINDFTGDAPVSGSSMLQQLGPRYEGPVALNPDKNVIENVGLIELYQTILERAMDLSISMTNPVSTPAISNALQLASTRLSDFYMLMGNEAYIDAKDPTIGFGSDSVGSGAASSSVHAFQNMTTSLLDEELALLRGQDANMARPVYNRLFWNFVKGEGEAAYATNYNMTDVNKDGFINEDDGMIFYPQGHGDAWGHYLTAIKQQYNLLRHDYFNWVSRSEFYNLMDVVMAVDFYDERKFATLAAQKAKAGREIVCLTYRNSYVEDVASQWQGYNDVNTDRAWGVQEWARRAGQGSYFDWVTANALLPAEHPNQSLEGLNKVQRSTVADIAQISSNFQYIQTIMSDADRGLNPLRVSSQAVPFDLFPDLSFALVPDVEPVGHFEQIYMRAVDAIDNVKVAWERANEASNRLRDVAITADQFSNDVYQENLTYENDLIAIFGTPYEGMIGSGKFYPAGYQGPDLALYMYVPTNSTNANNFPKPSTEILKLAADGKTVNGGDFYNAVNNNFLLKEMKDGFLLYTDMGQLRTSFMDTYMSNYTNFNANDAFYNVSGYADGKKVEQFGVALPITAGTYSFLAPSNWGNRQRTGEIQTVVAEMLQLELEIIQTVINYETIFSEACKTLNLISIKAEGMEENAEIDRTMMTLKHVMVTGNVALKNILNMMQDSEKTTEQLSIIMSESIPQNLPTGGLAISPGDALAPLRGSLSTISTGIQTGLSLTRRALESISMGLEAAFTITQDEMDTLKAGNERAAQYAEMLREISSLLNNEGSTRFQLFAQMEQMRTLDDKYRSILANGMRLIDEREAFNKRVAAMTQRNRYQDMTFRVQRNHALQVYDSLFDLAARYTYLAAKAYDYSTNFSDGNDASPKALYSEIVKARTIGTFVDGKPRIGGSGLSHSLAWLNTNYATKKSQLGFDNPQIETGKLSLRYEDQRILPHQYEPANPEPEVGQPSWTGASWEESDAAWRAFLENARVDDLWSEPEFRMRARPFAERQPEPGFVFRFRTTIEAGKNVFGHELTGGDHAYDPSLYATKVQSVGVWFSNYQSDNVDEDLAITPRVYLFPTGSDIMSLSDSSDPMDVRMWKIVDQAIPTPLPATNANLALSNYVPLIDSLDGNLGASRKFSSFRAYHDAGDVVSMDELIANTRFAGRSVWNTEWVMIIPGRMLNGDPEVGVDRFIKQITDIKLVFKTYGHSGN